MTNWPTKKLGELCEHHFSGVWGDNPDNNGNVFVVRVSDVKDSGVLDYDNLPLRYVKEEKIPKYQLRDSDLVVVKSSGSKKKIISGKTAIFVQQKGKKILASNFVLVLRPNQKLVSPKWLLFYLNGDEVKEFIKKIISITTYPNLKPQEYFKMEIPLPPIKIQKRIVARIEELFEKIDKAKELRQKAQEQTATILPSVLQEVFGKAKKKWKMNSLKNVIKLNQSGVWGDKPQKDQRSYPVIRSTEMTHGGQLDLTSVAYRYIPEDKIEKYSLKDGDLLIVKSSGSRNLIGRCILFNQPNDKKIYLFSNFIQRFRPNSLVVPKYLHYFLDFEGRKFVQLLQTTTTGLRNLPVKQYIELAIPIPSPHEQKKIVAYLDNLREKVEQLKQIQQNQLEELTEPKQSILDKAFKGEL